MLSKMSKSDKTMFYYLGLSLLVLIVLGVVFGVSSVKESFGKGRTTEEKECKAAGKNHAKGMFGSDTPAHAAGLKWKNRGTDIVNEINSRCNDEWGSGSRTQKPGRAMTAARMAARISSAQQYGIQEGARIVNDLLPRGELGINSLDPETDGDHHYN